ncbi:four-helix bundle copper-binding protein [Streptomyces gobiensis]|uniref:four-helix bundle copper-binding protein n=1 Tax=Streptomyces gobiensis TaxID=2875706 RepID=UPI001E627F7C|nr:four-helix bundle copper-binding protein [Streptomyces gobiensis]UGY93569.1 four-helix bundle copper-binding protein [Streptomyces gobiensis]
MPVREMTESYPMEINLDRDLISDTVQVLMECAQACTACGDSCLSEMEIGELAKCIRTDLDCADICETTARVLSRHTGYDANLTRAQLDACIQACTSCADECERHPRHDHCRICAETCRRCAEACRTMNEVIS